MLAPLLVSVGALVATGLASGVFSGVGEADSVGACVGVSVWEISWVAAAVAVGASVSVGVLTTGIGVAVGVLVAACVEVAMDDGDACGTVLIGVPPERAQLASMNKIARKSIYTIECFILDAIWSIFPRSEICTWGLLLRSSLIYFSGF